MDNHQQCAGHNPAVMQNWVSYDRLHDAQILTGRSQAKHGQQCPKEFVCALKMSAPNRQPRKLRSCYRDSVVVVVVVVVVVAVAAVLEVVAVVALAAVVAVLVVVPACTMSRRHVRWHSLPR